MLLNLLFTLLAALGLGATPPQVDPTYYCVDDGTPAWSCYLADDVPPAARVVFVGPRSAVPSN